MIRPYTTSVPSLLLGFLFSPLLLADDPPLELKQQIISAPSVESTTVADMAQYGSKVEIVTREQIERAGPAADVSRVMQMFIPGLYVAPKNGPFDYGTYSLLGGRNDDTLILLDGVRLNNRLYGGLYLDTLPANAIERIEVLKGGQSLLFGTQAVSGVINIVTRSPQTREASGEVNLGADTFGGTTGDARVEKIFNNGFGDLGLLAYVSRNVSEGYQPFRNRDMKNVSDKKRSYEVTTFGTKAIQSFGDDTRLELFYQYADANLDFARPVDNHKTTNDRVQQIATATFEQTLNERLSYFVKGHINDWDTRYTRINNIEGGGTRAINHNDYWGFTDWGVQAEGKAVLPGEHVLVFGSDNQWFKGQDDVLIIDDNKAQAHALYTQLRPTIEALPNWHPSIGVRHEAMSGGDSATVGMLTSLYDLNDNWALRGQYGTAYKLPNAEQLFVNEDDEKGNRNLKPEKSRNAELGVDYKGSLLARDFSASVTLFKRKITDLITLDDIQWVNGQGQIQMRGFEADAKLQLNEQWSVQADMTRNLTESRAGVTINDIPGFFARSRVGYESADRLWGAGTAVRYIGDIVSSKKVEYGNYTVVDADAYRYLDNAHQHRVSLLVENLFDRDYVTSRASNVDNLGRPFTSEVRYTYRF
ncbi:MULTISPECIES: TonB-dependent siderophore receptor [unclassified Pseudomonas]|uniref:TonB-dependent receptor plug domain-containing protein n=1 Tax=unclassified Pseudomonas TaxID=196821 RepID=UPI000C86D8FF|nr:MULTISPECIES: TonB-dependent receptor [unclassified Pseudomonas]PMU19122.1 TonB-dependent receptor [Pseudomonas sp. GP01-A9]PMU24877.1 TonB-dependent receptor [Pseudomonas sp. GP01-A13]PMU34207.1 TonB-dependent receptor [Pseudomonas sp. GP01-A8]PMU49009.1 TonB-dependent receptor [Pseudomonas sp. GP01-A6]PMU49023.1 TonB-dependent receptor [Pseudomonas sp. GP01-A14]